MRTRLEVSSYTVYGEGEFDYLGSIFVRQGPGGRYRAIPARGPSKYMWSIQDAETYLLEAAKKAAAVVSDVH